MRLLLLLLRRHFANTRSHSPITSAISCACVTKLQHIFSLFNAEVLCRVDQVRSFVWVCGSAKLDERGKDTTSRRASLASGRKEQKRNSCVMVERTLLYVAFSTICKCYLIRLTLIVFDVSNSNDANMTPSPAFAYCRFNSACKCRRNRITHRQILWYPNFRHFSAVKLVPTQSSNMSLYRRSKLSHDADVFGNHFSCSRRL